MSVAKFCAQNSHFHGQPRLCMTGRKGWLPNMSWGGDLYWSMGSKSQAGYGKSSKSMGGDHEDDHASRVQTPSVIRPSTKSVKDNSPSPLTIASQLGIWPNTHSGYSDGKTFPSTTDALIRACSNARQTLRVQSNAGPMTENPTMSEPVASFAHWVAERGVAAASSMRTLCPACRKTPPIRARP